MGWMDNVLICGLLAATQQKFDIDWVEIIVSKAFLERYFFLSFKVYSFFVILT